MREIKFRAWNTKDKCMGTAISLMELIKYTAANPHRLDQEPYLEIMQYTGLKDKTGREIYEGDIVKRYKEDVGVPIRWHGERACFEFAKMTSYILAMEYAISWYEVIGNIYESAELIEKERG